MSASGLQALTQSPLLFQGRAPPVLAASARGKEGDNGGLRWSLEEWGVVQGYHVAPTEGSPPWTFTFLLWAIEKVGSLPQVGFALV